MLWFKRCLFSFPIKLALNVSRILLSHYCDLHHLSNLPTPYDDAKAS